MLPANEHVWANLGDDDEHEEAEQDDEHERLGDALDKDAHLGREHVDGEADEARTDGDEQVGEYAEHGYLNVGLHREHSAKRVHPRGQNEQRRARRDERQHGAQVQVTIEKNCPIIGRRASWWALQATSKCYLVNT